MKTRRTIETILKDTKRIKPPLAPSTYAVLWVCFSLALIMTIIVLFFSVRSDLNTVLDQTWFLLNLASLAAVFLFSSYMGFKNSLPGRKPNRIERIGLQIALFGFFLTLVPSLLHMPLNSTIHYGIRLGGLKCSATLAVLGAIPGCSLFYLIRRLAPLRPATTAKMIGLAMGAMGSFGLGLDCMVQNPIHLIVYHGLPILLLGLLGALMGDRVLKW